MAIATKCQTPGVEYVTHIGKKIITLVLHLPLPLDIDKKEAEQLEANLHNAVELVLAPLFRGFDKD